MLYGYCLEHIKENVCCGGKIRHREEEGKVGAVALEWSGLRITKTSLCTNVTESRVETLLAV